MNEDDDKALKMATTPPVKKQRQHNQLRALLFNRLGLFDVKDNDATTAEASTQHERQEDADINNNATQQATSTATATPHPPLSQQYLKEGTRSKSTSNEAGDAATTSNGRRGLIRFNSIVSVVAIPTRFQYSNSVRNLLWGSSKKKQQQKKSKSGRDGSSWFYDDDDLDSTTSTREDRSRLTAARKKTLTSKPRPTGRKLPSRQRLVRKSSFHS